MSQESQHCTLISGGHTQSSSLSISGMRSGTRASIKDRGRSWLILPANGGGAMLLEDRLPRSEGSRGMTADASPPLFRLSGDGAGYLNTRHTLALGSTSGYLNPMRLDGRRTFWAAGLARSGRGTTGTVRPRLHGSMPTVFGICPPFGGGLALECGWTRDSIAPKNARARARAAGVRPIQRLTPKENRLTPIQFRDLLVQIAEHARPD